MTSIESISWEVLNLILSLLPRNNGDYDIVSQRFGVDLPQPSPSHLPFYATVCKSWAQHIERRTFKSLRLKSTELEEFSRIVKGHRASSLFNLEYEIILPTYSNHACAKFETSKDQDENNCVFTSAISGLFEVFKSWETNVKADENQRSHQSGSEWKMLHAPGTLNLVLSKIYSPMDGWYRGKDQYKEDRMEWELGKRHDLWDHRYEHSFLQLYQPEILPNISRIITFSANSSTRAIAPSSLVYIASKYANIKSIQWTCVDDEKKYPEVRQQLRYEFAQGLRQSSFDSLTSINLEYNHEAPSNHNFTPMTALHSSSPTTDYLSQAIHHFSQSPNLIEIHLEGPIVISPSLFWPTSPNDNQPTWPKLQRFHLKFNTCTPSGRWYFMRHISKSAADDQWDPEGEAMRDWHSESETDSDSNVSEDSAIWDSYHPIKEGRVQGNIPIRRFRDYPINEEMLPLLKATAKAVTCMPALELLILTGAPDSTPGTSFEVAFIATGLADSMDENPEDSSRSRLYWQTGDWRPDEELLNLWNKAAPGLLVRFVTS